MINYSIVDTQVPEESSDTKFGFSAILVNNPKYVGFIFRFKDVEFIETDVKGQFEVAHDLNIDMPSSVVLGPSEILEVQNTARELLDQIINDFFKLLEHGVGIEDLLKL